MRVQMYSQSYQPKNNFHIYEMIIPGRANFIYFIYLLSMIFLALFVIYVVYGPMIEKSFEGAYIGKNIAPKMQRIFGFTAGWRSIRISSATGDCGKIDDYVVTSMTPGGPLANMGFEIGDVPFEYHGGFIAFYRALQKACEGKTSSIEVYKFADAQKGKYIKREIIIRPLAQVEAHSPR